jgi:hypothetical protein
MEPILVKIKFLKTPYKSHAKTKEQQHQQKRQ